MDGDGNDGDNINDDDDDDDDVPNQCHCFISFFNRIYLEQAPTLWVAQNRLLNERRLPPPPPPSSPSYKKLN